MRLKLANRDKGQIFSFKRVGVKPPVEADLFAAPLGTDWLDEIGKRDQPARYFHVLFYHRRAWLCLESRA